jgi:hypothetical protein
MIEHDALLDEQEGSLIYMHECYFSAMSRFCIVEAVSDVWIE